MPKPRRTRFSAWNGRIAEIGNPDRNLSSIDSPPSLSEARDQSQDVNSSQPGLGSLDSDQKTDAVSSASPAPPPSWLRFLGSRRVQSSNKRQVGLLAVGCLALGLLGGYLLGRHSVKPTVFGGQDSTREGAVRLTTSELDQLDGAYTARYTHHYTEAEQSFTALGRTHPNWPIMKVELGRTMLYDGKLTGARTVLNTAAIGGMATADALFALGVVDMVKKNYREAETNLAAAVAADPTRPDFYFLWGECLRDQGRPLEAAERFRSALLRNSYETADGLYRLKLWLSEIDANVENDDGLSATIDTALAQPSPSMEVLFAAAARDLKAGKFQAATEHVRRARQCTDPEVCNVVLNDPTFVQVRGRPELAGMFQMEPTASTRPAGDSAPSPSTPAAGK